jgi:uncharacterized protein (TIGR02246 family)
MATLDSPAKRARRAAPLALAALAASACAALGGREVPGYVREIEAQNRALELAFRTGNLLGVADLYADDAVLIDARGERTTGRAEIDAYWSAIEHPLDWRLEIEDIHGSDTVAYEAGVSHLTTLHEGARHTSVVRFLVLWRRDASGAWKIELDAYWPEVR